MIPTSAASLVSRMLDEYEAGARFERADANDVLWHHNESTFPEAFGPNGRDILEALNADIDALERAGALRVARHHIRGGGERVELRLGPSEAVNAYTVATAHGYQPLRVLLNALERTAADLHAASLERADMPSWWRDYLVRVQDGARLADMRPISITRRGRLKKEWVEVRDALRAGDRLARTVDAWARHVSEALFSDSKRLAIIKARVAEMLRVADPRWEGMEAEDPDRILEVYGIRRRPRTITCAGAIQVRLGEQGQRTYRLDDFSPVATLPGAWGPAVATGAIASGIRLVTTIENEYPFLSYVEEAGGPAGLGARHELVVYAGGYLSNPVLDLLTRIAQAADPTESERFGIVFRHWGDADPAGLAIWWQMRSGIGRPVSLYRTTAEWVTAGAAREGQALSPGETRQLAIQADRLEAGVNAGEADTAAGAGSVDDLRQALALARAILAVGMKLEQERQ